MAHYRIAEYPFRAGESDLRLCHVFVDGEHKAQQLSVTQAMLSISQRAKNIDIVTVEWMGRGRKQFSAKHFKSLVKLLGLASEEPVPISKQQRRDKCFEQDYADAMALGKMQREADYYKIEIEYISADSAGPELWWDASWTVTVTTGQHGEVIGHSEHSLANALKNAVPEVSELETLKGPTPTAT